MPSEELNEAQVSRRLRDVAVSIPIGGVSSSASSDSREAECCLFNYLLDGLCARTLGPGIFCTCKLPVTPLLQTPCKCCEPSTGLNNSPGAALPAEGESWCLPLTYF